MTDDVDYAEGLGQVLWGQWSECLDWGRSHLVACLRDCK